VSGEMVVSSFRVLSRNSHGWNKEKHKISSQGSRYPETDWSTALPLHQPARLIPTQLGELWKDRV
jgi:hypothetical protein